VLTERRFGMAKIDECSPQDELFDAHLTVLQEYVRHSGEGEAADPNVLKRDIAAFKALVARSLDAPAAPTFTEVDVPRLVASTAAAVQILCPVNEC
jgi:hypothetical protein